MGYGKRMEEGAISKNSGKKEKLNEDVHSDSKRNFNN